MSKFITQDEASRLEALRACALLDTAPEGEFDAICRTAQTAFSAPVALVSLVDETRVWFKARCGIEPVEMSRSAAFRSRAILGGDILVVEDARCDPRFARTELSSGPYRFYAGAPLELEPGVRIGTLSILDFEPRTIAIPEQELLAGLAAVTVGLVRLHISRRQLEAELSDRQLRETRSRRQERAMAAMADELRARKARLRTTLEHMDQGLLMIDAEGVIQVSNARAAALLGVPGEFLAQRPSVADLRDWQVASGEFVGDTQPILETVVTGGLDGEERRYERRRVNGAVIEVRSRPLPGGGAVRTITDITDRRSSERALKESEKRLRQTEQRLAAALEATGDGVWDLDLRTGEGWVSDEWLRMLDLARGDASGGLAGWIAMVHPDDREQVLRALNAHLEGASAGYVCEYRIKARDRWLWILDRGRVVARDESGRALRAIGTHTDISARKEAEEELRLVGDRLQLALDAAGIGLLDHDVGSGALWKSESWYRMLGLDRDAFGPDLASWVSLVHPDDLALVRQRYDSHVRGETDLLEIEYRARHGDGRWVWVSTRARCVEHDSETGAARRIIGVQADISARKEAEQRAEHMARHDPLTELGNRRLLEERLGAALRAADPVAVLSLDLDRFKLVNDTLGHHTGDLLLEQIANRLRSAVRSGDTVARIGGDEFAIVQVGAPQPDGAQALAERVIAVLSAPLLVGDHDVTVGTSIGIALAPTDADDARTLLSKADLALYRAKTQERNAFRFYEPAMDKCVEERNRLEVDLRRALDRNELELHYQPIACSRTGETRGYEALIRWRHPTQGLVSPALFIPIAEQTGGINTIGAWLLREACSQAAGWPQAIHLAVNVSPVQLGSRNFVTAVVAALSSSGLEPSRLELEITETALIGDTDATSQVLEQLRALGLRIALDDFGTGYSSLSHLHRFTFDKIKIDRSFIDRIGDENTAAIVRAVVDLGRRWRCEITAEGVETPAQLEAVRAAGCSQVQGFLIGRPEPADRVLARLGAQGGLVA
ncbi:EAL domain-containing protein [Salinarimonas sp.]|uniref:EAL domain-containing protein n=1 Tax=Salinarimonas sp. TaxID=2766526 RepID=UPI0032D934CF